MITIPFWVVYALVGLLSLLVTYGIAFALARYPDVVCGIGVIIVGLALIGLLVTCINHGHEKVTSGFWRIYLFNSAVGLPFVGTAILAFRNGLRN